jgi:UDP-2,3-diacylglucosamine hydrolase
MDRGWTDRRQRPLSDCSSPAERARPRGRVVAVAHQGETEPEIETLVESVTWIKVGELGTMIDTFRTGRGRAGRDGGRDPQGALFENFAPDARA